jgi:NAD(P)-dependent dehydrogenase (short-subunit alcohol dehydrogenase family)
LKEESPGVGILSVVTDVTDESSVNVMVDKAVEAFGRLDYGNVLKKSIMINC